MKRAPLLSLLAVTVLGQTDPSNTVQTTDLSCQGTSTYTGYVPLQTVFVTVDGSYTYTPSGNDSTPPAAIFYTPPPACVSVVLPSSSSSSGNAALSSVLGDLSLALPAPAQTETQSQAANMTTYTEVITWTETTTTSNCVPNFAGAGATATLGPPYANSSTTTGGGASCLPFQRFGTYTTTQIFVSAAPAPGTAQNSGGHMHPQNPGQSSAQVNPPVVASTPPGRSDVATVTITKKTPVANYPTSTPEQIVFPPATPGSGSLNAVSPQAPARTPIASVGGGNSNNGGNNNGGNPAPTSGNSGGQDRPATIRASPNLVAPSPAGIANTPNVIAPSPAGNDNTPNVVAPSPTGAGNKPTNAINIPSASNKEGKPAVSASQGGGGMGSIINSAFNSPFTTVGVVTSYGAASATVSLVNGIPVQVQSSSVYIGGSYVAIPTGSSTALVTVNQQTFTIVSGAIIGGSSTLEIHRSAKVSSSPVQAATLSASTITQNGVVVTIEPTAAVVDGKTYSIGLNAGETKIMVNGQTVTLNSNGVAFASTTYKPAMTTTSAYVVSTIGSLTFSIDSSEAIISGTTYRIGAGALNSLVTTTIGGTQVVFGPSGIILPSTTIAPTGVSLTGANIGSAATSESAAIGVVSQTAPGLTSTSNGATATLQPPIYLSNSLCMFSILLALSTLPLGLLL